MPELHSSARKHYHRDKLDDDALHYAASHVLNSRPLDDEDDPRRWLMIAVGLVDFWSSWPSSTTTATS